MESNILLENLCPGEILILYKEDESYVYARNDGHGLIIERAFVLDTQKRKSQEEYNRLDEIQLEKTAKKIGDKLKARKKDKDKEPDPESAFIHMLLSSV